MRLVATSGDQMLSFPLRQGSTLVGRHPSCHVCIPAKGLSRRHCQVFVDGRFAHGFIDRDQSRYPIPDTGKFGFRLIGSDVMADTRGFRVYSIEPDESIWTPWE